MSDASTQGTPEHGAGLSATGRTADQFSPGDDAPGDTYGEPRGTGTEDDEVTSSEDRNAAESSGETSGGATAEG